MLRDTLLLTMKSAYAALAHTSVPIWTAQERGRKRRELIRYLPAYAPPPCVNSILNCRIRWIAAIAPEKASVFTKPSSLTLREDRVSRTHSLFGAIVWTARPVRQSGASPNHCEWSMLQVRHWQLSFAQELDNDQPVTSTSSIALFARCARESRSCVVSTQVLPKSANRPVGLGAGLFRFAIASIAYGCGRAKQTHGKNRGNHPLRRFETPRLTLIMDTSLPTASRVLGTPVQCTGATLVQQYARLMISCVSMNQV